MSHGARTSRPHQLSTRALIDIDSFHLPPRRTDVPKENSDGRHLTVEADLRLTTEPATSVGVHIPMEVKALLDPGV